MADQIKDIRDACAGKLARAIHDIASRSHDLTEKERIVLLMWINQSAMLGLFGTTDPTKILNITEKHLLNESNMYQ